MKEIYSWVPWFRELGKKIAEGGEQFLIEKAKAVTWKKAGNGDQSLLNYGDDNIDPFSFFTTLASLKEGQETRNRVYPDIQNRFGLTEVLPFDLDDAFIFPTPYRGNLLFHDGKGGDPALLWRLFRDAVAGFEAVKPDDFDQALGLKGIATTKLTQALFLVNPCEFLPIGDHIKSLGSFGSIPKAKGINLEEYASCIEKIREGFPGCELYEINLLAYLQSAVWTHVGGQVFQISTNAHDGGTDDCWEEFRTNNYVYAGQPDGKCGFPLEEPGAGDVILVRSGQDEGRGVGVVYRNDYQDEPDEAQRLHVIWLNKERAKLNHFTTMPGFGRAGEVVNSFRESEEYATMFGLLDRLSKEDSSGPEQSTEQEIDKRQFPLNQILYGPPGTGKTWRTRNLSLEIIGEISDDKELNQQRYDELRFDREEGTGRIEMVTFHQNFAYEDFIEGIRPKINEEGTLLYEMHIGIFKRLVEAAMKRRNERFVLIIDEINRGNIAKIFGELITLIEDSKRAGRADATHVTLPYSGKRFEIPDNLYLIGTMNTADRSIQLLDTALRRRFTFIEMMPEPGHEGICRNIEGIDCSKLLKAINRRVAALLDRERQIGHTYLLDVDSMEKLSEAMRTRILPLLQEYFFDDWAKIRAVLGQNGFVTESPAENLMTDQYMNEEERVVHERLPADDTAWNEPGEYRKIYKKDMPGEMEES